MLLPGITGWDNDNFREFLNSYNRTNDMQMTIVNGIKGATNDGEIFSRDQGAKQNRARA
jgi:hypothetical protein